MGFMKRSSASRDRDMRNFLLGVMIFIGTTLSMADANEKGWFKVWLTSLASLVCVTYGLMCTWSMNIAQLYS